MGCFDHQSYDFREGSGFLGIVNHGFEARKIESNFHHWLVTIRILDLQNGFCFGILVFSLGDFFQISNSQYIFPDLQLSKLGGSFKYFLFSPRKLGKIPILTSILFRWVGSTTNQLAKSSPCSFVSLSTHSTHRLLGAVPWVSVAQRPQVGWTVKDLDLIEANEAFAAQALAVNKVPVVTR